ncbi:hypothetical protein D3C76_1674590 [compost metagenome]
MVSTRLVPYFWHKPVLWRRSRFFLTLLPTPSALCSNQWDRMRPLPPCRLSPLIWAAISWQTRSRLIVINGSQPCWLATPPVPVSSI